jgi:hypothetical protein
MPDQHDLLQGRIQHPHLGAQRVHGAHQRSAQPGLGPVELQRRRPGVSNGGIERTLLEQAASHCRRLQTATDTAGL